MIRCTEQVAELYRSVANISAKLSGSQETELVLPESASDLSYLVSYVLEIDSEEKQKLLEMDSTGERLRCSLPISPMCSKS